MVLSPPPSHDRFAERLVSACVFALILGAVLIGCSPRSEVLAVVGDQTITVKDFLEVAQSSGGAYANLPPDTAKARLLDDLVRRAILLEAAKAHGLDRDGSVRREVEDQALVTALAERLAPRTVPVSEAEILELHRWRSTEARAQVIFAAELGRVNAALDELRQGRDFGDVANRFNPAGLLPPDGDLGYIVAGSLVNPLDDILREAPVGKIVGPVRSLGEGWFIVRVADRRPREPESLEETHDRLAQLLRQRKQRAVAVRHFLGLRDQYRLAVEPEGPYLMFARYNEPLPEGAARPDPTPDERKRVLARWDGGPNFRGVYTLGDALDDLDQGGGDRPDPQNLGSFKQWIESRALRRVGMIEAKRRHLGEEAAVARQIKNQADGRLLETVYQNEVVYPARATEADVRAVYERQAVLFVRLDWVRLQHLTLPDSGSAARVVERARPAPTLRDAILLSSEGLPIEEETVRFPNSDPVWEPLRRTFIEMEPGTYGGPVRVGGNRWRIFQVLAKQQVFPPFESLAPMVQQNFRQQAMELAYDRRLKALTDSLSQVLRAQVFPERLRRVPWPPPMGRGEAG